MTRKPIVAANWKMNMGPAETAGFAEEFLRKIGDKIGKIGDGAKFFSFEKLRNFARPNRRTVSPSGK